LHGDRTFPKTERLQSGWQFRRIYDTGRCHKGRRMVLYTLATPDGPRQVGVVTSRRIGNAVARNRARRLFREAYRLNKHKLTDHLQLVMIARTAIRQATLRELETEMLALWQEAGVITAT